MDLTGMRTCRLFQGHTAPTHASSRTATTGTANASDCFLVAHLMAPSKDVQSRRPRNVVGGMHLPDNFVAFPDTDSIANQTFLLTNL